MKKKLLAVLMTGIMAMSFAATTTAVYAKGDYQLLGKCLSVLSPKHLNRKQRNYVQRLRIKKTLKKMNMLPLMNFFMKFGKSISFT